MMRRERGRGHGEWREVRIRHREREKCGERDSADPLSLGEREGKEDAIWLF